MTPPQPELMVTRHLPDDLSASARAMLDEAFAGDFAESDWEHALGGWHVAVVEVGAVLAHAAIVGRVLRVGDRPVGTGYVEAVATTPARQRSGLGSRVMVLRVGVSEDVDLAAPISCEARAGDDW